MGSGQDETRRPQTKKVAFRLYFARILEKTYSLNTKKIKHEIFNAGFNQNHSTKRDLIKLIIKISGKKNSRVIFREFAGSDPRNYKVNFNKLNKAINLKPRFNLEEGISQIIEYINNGIINNYKKSIKLGNFSINI